MPLTTLAAPCAGFTDVDSAASYCAAVELLKNKAVISGCTASTYCPSGNVTRAEMALFMRRIVRGGPDNVLATPTATVGGGDTNVTSADYATISGGTHNQAVAYATVAGGQYNVASAQSSAIAGGGFNHADGDYSFVAGGLANTAATYYTFAAGWFAEPDQVHCAVFGLWSTNTAMNCIGSPNIFRIGADHGFSVDYQSQRPDGGGTRWVGIGNIFANQTISTWTGAYLSDSGNWISVSDRNRKTDITAIDLQATLDKVIAMPVSSWRYLGEGDERHVGPMAQDFHAAFGLGPDERHISTLDEAGVAFAAIKGLASRQAEALARKDGEIAELRARLDAIERSLAHR